MIAVPGLIGIADLAQLTKLPRCALLWPTFSPRMPERVQEFEGDTAKIWQSNIFGRSFHEIVSEDLQAKLKRMPDDARA